MIDHLVNLFASGHSLGVLSIDGTKWFFQLDQVIIRKVNINLILNAYQ